MRSNKYITINRMSTILMVKRLTIIRDLKKLKELNIVKRVGSDKTGYWEVITNND